MTLNQQLVSDKPSIVLFPKYQETINREEAGKKLINIVNSLERDFNKFQNKKHMYYCLAMLERIKEEYVNKKRYNPNVFKRCQYVSRLLKMLRSYKKLETIEKEKLMSMIVEVVLRTDLLKIGNVDLSYGEMPFIISIHYTCFAQGIEDNQNLKPIKIEFDKLYRNQLLENRFECFEDYISSPKLTPLSVTARFAYLNKKYFREAFGDSYYKFIMAEAMRWIEKWVEKSRIKINLNDIEKYIREERYLKSIYYVERLFSTLFFNNENETKEIIMKMIENMDQ